MRARYPDRGGYLERDGVKVFYEVHGEGHWPTILLMSNAPGAPLRHWKAQIPFLGRHFRVVAFDAPGNGMADRPQSPESYTDEAETGYAVAVMDATGTERAVFVSYDDPSVWSLQLAATHPERVLGIVAITPSVPWLTEGHPHRAVYDFDAKLDTDEGWAKVNRHSLLRDWRGFIEWAAAQSLPEPHSTKQIEDFIAWGMETDARTALAHVDADLAAGYSHGGPEHDPLGSESPRTVPAGWISPSSKEEAEALCRAVSCPVLVIQGELDAWRPLSRGARLAELTAGKFVVLEGSGSAPHGRHPVKVNLLIKDFVDSICPPRPARRTWTRALSRPKRVLYLSSPIGLGHALRDVAIAQELRRLKSDLQIDWLTQHPVTEVLNVRGERVHPASDHLANESAHIEGVAAEHDLRVFQAVRDMDEILVANFHVFQDLIEDEPYDVVIGDESWDVDHFLHENPELKRAPFVWMTDFVGWLPMADGGQREAFVAADYNAEMIEHIDRFPHLRDRSIFVGNPEDIVPDRLGPELPGIRAWTEAHYEFAGYVLPFDPAGFEREALRAELGYASGEKVCLVTVGGSGVGEHLLRRVIEAYPEAKTLVPGLRMVVVAGPRIDPGSMPSGDALEVRGYVDQLYRHMAACDLAVVQGGLSTTMELAALKRPFLYFPIRHHFEQNFHVRHRLDRYGAGRCMEYAASAPEVIAKAIAEEIAKPVAYRPVETDGAARAAAMIAELL